MRAGTRVYRSASRCDSAGPDSLWVGECRLSGGGRSGWLASGGGGARNSIDVTRSMKAFTWRSDMALCSVSRGRMEGTPPQPSIPGGRDTGHCHSPSQRTERDRQLTVSVTYPTVRDTRHIHYTDSFPGIPQLGQSS